MLRRHEAWRTSFQIVDGEVVPIVHHDLYVTLPLVDLTGLPAADREAEALRLATEDSHAPIDLTAPPLFRARVFKIAEDDHRLHLTLHHIIFDGVSIYRIVVPELSAIYDAYAAGRTPAARSARPAIWRLCRLARASDVDAIQSPSRWIIGGRTCAGRLPVLQLPFDRPRPSMPSYRGSMETFSLSGPLTEALKALSRKEGLTLYMTTARGVQGAAAPLLRPGRHHHRRRHRHAPAARAAKSGGLFSQLARLAHQAARPVAVPRVSGASRRHRRRRARAPATCRSIVSSATSSPSAN